MLRLAGSVPVSLSLDDVSGAPGQTVQTALRTTNPMNWAGGHFVVVYDANVIAEIPAVTLTGLSSDFGLSYADDGMGFLYIAMADDTMVGDDGAIAIISLSIVPRPFNSSPSFTFTSGILNYLPLAVTSNDLNW